MKKGIISIVIAVVAAVTSVSCMGPGKIIKTGDPKLMYSKALEYYGKEKWSKASLLFEAVQHYYIGTTAQDSISFFNARCKFKDRDWMQHLKPHQSFDASYCIDIIPGTGQGR